MALQSDLLQSLAWLSDAGVKSLADLNPCVPGEPTLAEAYYVNAATPHVVYRGGEEGSLPMVRGRWFLMPATVTTQIPTLLRDAAPVSRAVTLTRS